MLPNPIHPLVESALRKRHAAGLSVRRVATLTGVSYSTLARLERGEGSPDDHTRRCLAAWLDDGTKPAPRAEVAPAAEHYSVKIERRVARLEDQMSEVLRRIGP